MRRFSCGRWLITTLLLAAALPAMAADYVIDNLDAGTGQGLDDATPTMPVGDNAGTTLGAQRRIAFERAVRIVVGRVGSPVPIRIQASMPGDGSAGLSCDRNTGTLGIGGATNYAAGFDGAPADDVVYPLALANALAGRRLTDAADDIQVYINGQLDAGRESCLRGTAWYYGLDGDPGDGELDFVGTVVHELIHGLGFQSIVALTDGDGLRAGQFPAFADGTRDPDVYSTFVQDLAMPGSPRWPQMTAAERRDSLDDGPYVVWASPVTSNAAAGYLTDGTTQGRVALYAPSPVAPASSISHWAADIAPAQIMAPYESPETSVRAGLGMAACVLQDIGWQLAGGTRCPDVDAPTIVGDPQGGYAAELSATSDSDDTGDNDSSGGSGGGGGGCTLASGQRFDPLWPALLLLAAAVLVWRRGRRRI